MAASLIALLSKQAPIQTRKGLIITGLQNDFLSPDGKLPVSTTPGFIDRLKELTTEFRDHGDVVWVRSEFKENRDVNREDSTGESVIVGPKTVRTAHSDDDSDQNESPEVLKPGDSGRPAHAQPDEPDEELFLTQTSNRQPCCIPGSSGADYTTEVKDLVDGKRDLQLIKTYYSAFTSTSLLTTLRAKLVTELFICGCTTNLSVFATAMDAARHGIRVTLVEDCLGYRRKDRHEMAINELREIMGAHVLTSAEVVDRLKNPPPPSEVDESDEDDESDVGSDLAFEERIAGRERSGVSAGGLLEVDSDEDGDEDEDDAATSLVRPSTLFGNRIPHRYSSLRETSRLQSTVDAAQGGEPELAVESAKSSSARTSDANGHPNRQLREPSIESDGHGRGGKRKNIVECGLVPRTTGDCSITGRDGSFPEGVGRSAPWADIIDDKQIEQPEATSEPAKKVKHPGLAAMVALAGLDSKTAGEYEQAMAEARLNNAVDQTQSRDNRPLLGEGKESESAGSCITYGLLPPELASKAFDDLNDEITWQTMHHQTGEVPRLVCCQGSIEADGSMPVYRHPSDQTLPIQPFTPTVDSIRKTAEEIVGHSLNHTLIQLYRGRTDFISEHSDKTLDIVKGSSIANVSFGAQRTMRLRTKRVAASATPGRTTHRVPLPHNSMITMSLPTNAEYLHSIPADKRPAAELCEAEKACNERRISLTFRHIGTFLTRDSRRIWGQGARGKCKGDARVVLEGGGDGLVRAFGAENRASGVEWDGVYGEGFDVLHLKS